MAAYAAVTSLMHIIKQIQHHPHPPISYDKEQLASLTEKVAFLKEFLEGYSHVVGYKKELDGVESRIANAAHAAEDIIESHVVDQILVGSTSRGKRISSVDFHEFLLKVEEDMESIRKEVVEIKEKIGVQWNYSSISVGSLRSSNWRKSRMVGFEDVLYKMKDRLTGGGPNLQIVSIVGMAGIGKTTLARNIYVDPVIVQHFDIFAWVTISQEYRIREILLKLFKEEGEDLSQMDDNELGERLYQNLFDRRYLVVMDDIWDVGVLKQLNFFFPDNKNGSKLVLTTRLSNLTSQIPHCSGIELDFLGEDDSWQLFCENAFGKEADCPHDIKKVGKKIVKICKGLPLSIIVIGGLLSKSQQSQQYWEHVAENLNSIVNLEDDEHCLQILYLSYNSLPVHLKPCFLYMGVFPEDSEISVSELTKLWVAEGFLKPIDGKSLEEVAKGYLEEILDRNLILVEMAGLLGKIKSFKIHDLLWDLCVREAKKQKFLCFVSETSSENSLGVNTERRRICTRKSTPTEKYPTRVINALESASLARSLIWQFQEAIPSSGLKLLRVYSTISRGIHLDEVKSPETSDGFYSLEAIFRRLNLRYIYIGADLSPLSGFPSTISLLWNLHTLIIDVSLFNHVTAPSEIWDMTQLRHVDCTALRLPNPPDGHMRVLAELQTLRIIMNLKFGEEMVKRIPNIKNLRIIYDEFDRESLKNLSLLPKLECLHLHLDDGEIIPRDLVHSLAFPHSLKKLSLNSNVLHWEDMNPTKIGSLPLLQVLKLSIHGSHWETVEGQFCSLKVLVIRDCDLEYWMTEDTHFPRLEYLILERLEALKEIPTSIGDIPTLLTILLEDCSQSAVDSVKRLQDEQEDLGNILLDVQVRP